MRDNVKRRILTKKMPLNFTGRIYEKYIANIITSCRILLSGAMLLFPVFSYGFYITYVFCGISDMLDGVVARKTNNTDEFGAKLDPIAARFYEMYQNKDERH